MLVVGRRARTKLVDVVWPKRLTKLIHTAPQEVVDVSAVGAVLTERFVPA